MDETRLNQCVTRINAAISCIFRQIDVIHHQVSTLLEASCQQGTQPRSTDIATLKPLISEQLSLGHPCIQGNGVLFAPNVLSDREMYCEWWHKSTGERPAPMTLNFNQNSETYYNYIKMKWFSTPKETAQSTVVGPYVDLYGQDMYILTFSRPIHIRDEFVGVAGADIALNRLENILIAELMKVKDEALIITREGRVVAANTADWCAGDMARGLLARRTARKVTELPSTLSNWSLLTIPQHLPDGEGCLTH
ncbi:cache domain-containing protein [Zobellella taiwanensis]